LAKLLYDREFRSHHAKLAPYRLLPLPLIYLSLEADARHDLLSLLRSRVLVHRLLGSRRFRIRNRT
jgi:hypothetical protein